MNLNSYIGLMGGSYREPRDAARHGARCRRRGARADLDVPDPDYVLTLDADSVLLPEYCLRLVHLLEQPRATRDVAVAQTPYSAFPGAPTRIERIAGATTDLQHIVHQGMTHYDATFWVGANAVLRKRALDDIVEIEPRRRLRDPPLHPGPHGHRGHRVEHRPRRCTAGALQLPRAAQLPRDAARLRLALHPAPALGQRRPADPARSCVALARRASAAARRGSDRRAVPALNYLASISWASLGPLLLLVYPFDQQLLLARSCSLTALPYFVAMATDLQRCGYKRTDVLRIYGFNLILLPVNRSGVVKSLGQAIGGQKIAFKRTPKVKSRTTRRSRSSRSRT